MFSKQTNSAKSGLSAFDTPSPPPTPTEGPTRKAAKMASLLAADLVIDGEVASEGELHVEGMIRGDVRAPRLSIGETGQIEGNIHADVVEARGRVVGSITAKQVRLLATGHVEGDITHEQLTMETGAYFQGRSLKFQRPAVAPTITPAAANAGKPDTTKPDVVTLAPAS